ncbi:hypothetical protein [Paraburkholderia sp. D1E]
MTTIPAVIDPISGIQSPASAFPDGAIAIICDGSVYTIYQPGDQVPQPQE